MAKQALNAAGGFIAPKSDPSPTRTSTVGGTPMVIGVGVYDPQLSAGQLGSMLGIHGDAVAAGLIDGHPSATPPTNNSAMKPTEL